MSNQKIQNINKTGSFRIASFEFEVKIQKFKKEIINIAKHIEDVNVKVKVFIFLLLLLKHE